MAQTERRARQQRARSRWNGHDNVRITIVNDVALSFNPRSVKEADALAEGGYSVRVVSVDKSARLYAATARLLAGRAWDYQAVDYSPDSFAGFLRWVGSGVRQKVFKRLSRYQLGFGFAERALCRYQRAFLKAASAPTDMFIAHNITSLPIAAAAARLQRVPLGFDIEDYHCDEETPAPDMHLRRELKAYLMRKYLPGCAYLSATSNLMADTIAAELGVTRPVPIYNAFPLTQATGIQPPALRPLPAEQAPLTAYWFSHVVGLDRGLQDFILAMAHMKRRIELYLRGQVSAEAKSKLLALAAEAGVSEQIFFLPVVAADELISDAARFDFGLALEQPINQNRQITVTNKLFTYLLAGIIPVATATLGQCEVLEQIGGCGVLYRPGAIEELATQMNQLIANPQLMQETKKAAWAAARTKFCWDVEKHKLLAAIDSVVRSACAQRA